MTKTTISEGFTNQGERIDDIVSDYVKTISQCRRRRACICEGELLGGGKGNREEGGEVSLQPTRNQSGREFAPRHKGGISKKVKERFPGGKGRDFQATKRGYQKGPWGHAPLCIYCANKRLCLGYK